MAMCAFGNPNPDSGTTDLKYLMVPYMLAEAGVPKRSGKGKLGRYAFTFWKVFAQYKQV